jgi:uncharacterized small protein (DUF1192 family)
VIGRRSSRKDDKAQQDAASTHAPLFDLDELHERRILSWSPEPEEDVDEGEEPQAVEAPSPATPERRVEPAPRAPDTHEVPERPAAPQARVEAPPPAPERRDAAPSRNQAPPARAAAPVEAPGPAESGRTQPPDGEDRPRRRGRPRGRPRRQVHFHVDPDEERLLMAAVERYGSQQKGLVAALESLQAADLLRDEIERLRAESARYRKLLDEAESLFNR